MPEQHQKQIFVEAPPWSILPATKSLQVPPPRNGNRDIPLPRTVIVPERLPAYHDTVDLDRSVDTRTQILASLNVLAGTVLTITGDFFWRFNEYGNEKVLNILDNFPAFENLTSFLYSRPYTKLIPTWEAKAAFYAGLGLIGVSLLVLSGSIIASKLSPKGVRNRK